ncbi:papilin b, proteoglycan-like sulfated glycoprotein [Syngnathus typhle]|uniref:papilin b, proteoglycan-like sulfated glycoprotein n=1 Tax=Syngnathus typhle TaxID=161592 RepID=UPI002A6A0885|nr:papilin b, proteoglycan-like sulfated glycoprotein [Syngnathus typhle]
MDTLRVLALVHLLAVPAFTQSQTLQDHWGEFGPFGPCSRSCGTGVAMRTRECITLRTDGGHNCKGSSKSFQLCNLNECPVGSRDFREEQCSQFDRIFVQGKHHTWVPYYGANPCELNCITREHNTVYRHRPKVVDGTLCHVGRNDICVDGMCKAVSQGVILGLEDVPQPEYSAPTDTAHPDGTRTYEYRANAYAACSTTCGGGMQYRTVECWLRDQLDSRTVAESFCIDQGLQRPQWQQACNTDSCGAKYRVSAFSQCSVTCGAGQQTREVTCEGAEGERLDDSACAAFARPSSVQVCRRPACRGHVTWHVASYGLCTRSCGGGVRERQVGCFDGSLTPYPVVRCGITRRPVTVEECNVQPCHQAQSVPSLQSPGLHESTTTGFVPYVPATPSSIRPNTNNNPNVRVNAPDCARSYYGCCPDGRSAASGPGLEGCARHDCVNSRYGCCLDGVTAASGFGRAGCSEYQTTVHTSHPVRLVPHGACSLPRFEGPCDTWKRRFYYNASTGRCQEFWFGGCQGNNNNFASLGECQTACETAAAY